MPVTFGSVGDIIAVVQLFSDLVTALRDCRGSAHDFQLLIRQLQALAVTVQEVDNIIKTHEVAPELDALRQSLGYTAAACQTSATAFYDQIKKYQASLRPRGSGNSARDVARKAQWRVIESSDVERFRAEMVAHTSSLRALLTLWNVKVGDRQHAKTHQSLDVMTTAVQSSNQTQEGLLRQLLGRIDQTVDVSQRTNAALQSLAAASQWCWLRTFAVDVIKKMTDLQQCTFSIYSTVLEVNTNLSTLMRETLLGGHGSCTLVDAFGRRLQMHLEFINSWDVFDAVLEARFRSKPGYNKIVKKDFALRDDRCGRDVLRERPWDAAVKAGQHINMEMIFRGSTEQELEARLCPGCSRRSDRPGCSFECPSCGMRYVTDIEKQVAPPRSKAPLFTQDTEPTEHSERSSHVDHPSDFIRVRVKLRLLTVSSDNEWQLSPKEHMKRKVSRAIKTNHGDNKPAPRSPPISEDDTDHEDDTDDDDDTDDEGYYPSDSTQPPPAFNDHFHSNSGCTCADCVPQREMIPKATAADAHRAHISAGFGIKRWNPTKEPIILDDMVFDSESLRTWQEQQKEATDRYPGNWEPREDRKGDPSEAHEIASAMELARQQLEGLDSRSASEANAELETLEVSRKPVTLRPDKLDIKLPSILDMMPSSQLPTPPTSTEMEREDPLQAELGGEEVLAE